MIMGKLILPAHKLDITCPDPQNVFCGCQRSECRSQVFPKVELFWLRFCRAPLAPRAYWAKASIPSWALYFWRPSKSSRLCWKCPLESMDVRKTWTSPAIPLTSIPRNHQVKPGKCLVTRKGTHVRVPETEPREAHGQ